MLLVGDISQHSLSKIFVLKSHFREILGYEYAFKTFINMNIFGEK